MKKHDASYFPYLPLFYILEGVKVGYFLSITQPFLRNSEFKTSASHCCAKQFWILLLFMMMNGFYSNRLIWGGARLCGGNSSTTWLFFVFRWLSIFWITNGCLLDTSVCLTIRAAFAVQIGFPADLSMLAIILTAPPHCSQVSISIPKTRLSLCAQVIDWCFCTRVLSWPVGNACLALFRKAGVIVTRCRLFAANTPWPIHREWISTTTGCP